MHYDKSPKIVQSNDVKRVVHDADHYQREGWKLNSLRWERVEGTDICLYKAVLTRKFRTALNDWWARTKWNLFGEVKGLIWMAGIGILIYILLAVIGIAGIVALVKWLWPLL
jgi:hypothetical protein